MNPMIACVSELSVADRQQALLAHCAALSINAVHEPCNRSKERLAHADHLARAVWLDMAAAGWVPTVDTFTVPPRPRRRGLSSMFLRQVYSDELKITVSKCSLVSSGLGRSCS